MRAGQYCAGGFRALKCRGCDDQVVYVLGWFSYAIRLRANFSMLRTNVSVISWISAACILALAASPTVCLAQASPTKEQLSRWLERFPQADANHDGVLTAEEALAFRGTQVPADASTKEERNPNKVVRKDADRKNPDRKNPGAPRVFKVDPGWDREKFPDHAVCYLSPAEILEVYQSTLDDNRPALVSFDPPEDGALRVVATGHSFMAPGYKTLPTICRAAGMEQPLYTHTGGGITGSARYKWEEENGIFEFDRRPIPKLLASIANAEWDAMLWGPYFNDRPKYYACWVDFCLKYNPQMKFYLSDAWPQLYRFDALPKSEDFFTDQVLEQWGAIHRQDYLDQVGPLQQDYPNKVFIMPTCDAMVLAAKAFQKGDLPGIEGLHRVIGKQEKSLWVDSLGHLGPGFEWLEGYVFYATLYGRSPELIEDRVVPDNPSSFPSPELDRQFRKIAWQAVTRHPFSGIKDENGDGLRD